MKYNRKNLTMGILFIVGRRRISVVIISIHKTVQFDSKINQRHLSQELVRKIFVLKSIQHFINDTNFIFIFKFQKFWLQNN